MRTYVYLLNKYLWKKDQEDTFVFTNRTIMDALGYATENKNSLISKTISNILKSLKREGIIDYVEYYENIVGSKGQLIPTPKKRLTFVARSESELKKI